MEFKCTTCFSVETYSGLPKHCNVCTSNTLHEYLHLPDDTILTSLNKYENPKPNKSEWICTLFPIDENEIDSDTKALILKYYHQYVTSYRCWIYTRLLKDNEILAQFHTNPLDINKKLRENIFTKEALFIKELINKAPKIKKDIVVYRGINDFFDFNTGDIFEHKGFPFCSLEESTALFFTKDTSTGYGANKNHLFTVMNKIEGTIFVITLKKGTKVLDFSYYSPAFSSACWSEIVMDTHLKFKITDIVKNKVYMELCV